MLLFSERHRLALQFEKWAADNKAADCPLNVVTFLAGLGLLNEEKCREHLKNGGDKKNDTLHG